MGTGRTGRNLLLQFLAFWFCNRHYTPAHHRPAELFSYREAGYCGCRCFQCCDLHRQYHRDFVGINTNAAFLHATGFMGGMVAPALFAVAFWHDDIHGWTGIFCQNPLFTGALYCVWCSKLTPMPHLLFGSLLKTGLGAMYWWNFTGAGVHIQLVGKAIAGTHIFQVVEIGECQKATLHPGMRTLPTCCFIKICRKSLLGLCWRIPNTKGSP